MKPRKCPLRFRHAWSPFPHISVPTSSSAVRYLPKEFYAVSKKQGALSDSEWKLDAAIVRFDATRGDVEMDARIG